MSILKTYYLLSKPVLDYVSLIFCVTNFLRLRMEKKIIM